jgi:hypothetical protein
MGSKKRFTFLIMKKKTYLFRWRDLLDRSRYTERRTFSEDEIEPYLKAKMKWSELDEYGEDIIITEEMEKELNKN